MQWCSSRATAQLPWINAVLEAAGAGVAELFRIRIRLALLPTLSLFDLTPYCVCKGHFCQIRLVGILASLQALGSFGLFSLCSLAAGFGFVYLVVNQRENGRYKWHVGHDDLSIASVDLAAGAVERFLFARPNGMFCCMCTLGLSGGIVRRQKI